MDYMEQRAFVIDDGVLWLFPPSVVTDSVCVVQTADGFLYQIILIGRTFFRSGVVRWGQRLSISRMGAGKNGKGRLLDCVN